MNNQQGRDDSCECLEIEQPHDSPPGNEFLGSFLQLPQNVGTWNYALLVVLLIVFTWQFLAFQHHSGTSIACISNSNNRPCDLRSTDPLTPLNVSMSSKPTIPLTLPEETSNNTPIDNAETQRTRLPPSTVPSPYVNNQTFDVDVTCCNCTTTKGNENTHCQDIKYVLYFTESGWANQVICMEHAFYLARALNRTLILPPILPHLGKGSLMARDVFGMDSERFKTDIDPLKFYVGKLPKEKYIPISKVLDLQYSFAQVPTVDAKDFVSLQNTNSTTRWVVEYNYSHFTTEWILNRPDKESQVNSLTRQEYGQTRHLNMTYRDLWNTLGTHQEDILVFLDGYKSVFHESAMEPYFQPRMSEPIRLAAQAIRARWNVSAYAAIHIRGGDGWFAEEMTLQETIITAMDQISQTLTKWLENLEDGVKVVGLYVATDVKDLFQRRDMVHEVTKLVEDVRDSHDALVRILSGQNITHDLQEWEDLRYANVFMDIQMAACAPIGFVGTNGSTFSSLIQLHRHESSC